MNVLRIVYPEQDHRVSRREAELVEALKIDIDDLRNEVVDGMSDAIGVAGSDVPSLNVLRDVLSATAATLRKTSGRA